MNECLPDYAGFVFAKSRRQVTVEQAGELSALLRPKIVPVGVFVNEEVEKVAQLLNEQIIQVAQLHGDETEDYICRLKELARNAKIIKAVRVKAAEDILQNQTTAADYLLFDTFSAREYGGTGKTFDWSLIRQVSKPFFLAGGINAENVKDAIRQVRPYAIDASSAVETDGFKDREKILDFIWRIRKCQMEDMESMADSIYRKP